MGTSVRARYLRQLRLEERKGRGIKILNVRYLVDYGIAFDWISGMYLDPKDPGEQIDQVNHGLVRPHMAERKKD